MRPLLVPRECRCSRAVFVAMPLIAALCLLLLAAVARADMIFLKDGFVIQGKAKQESTLIHDPYSGEAFGVPKGYVYVDDGARVIFFSPAQVQDVDSSVIAVEDTVITQRKIIVVEPIGAPALYDVLDAGVFDSKWNRIIRYQTRKGPVDIRQHLSLINSYFVRADSTGLFNLGSYYLTRELGGDETRRLLLEHPDFQDPINLDVATRSARRFRMYEFCVHAGWYNEAADELERILKDLPSEQKKVDVAREKLSKLQSARHSESIQRAQRAGRYRWAAEQLPLFSERYGTVKAFDQVRGLKTALAATEAKLAQAKASLPALLKRINRPEQKQVFADAVPIILAELHPDTVGRLDTFIKLAEIAERQEKATGRTSIIPADLLSLAVTGWVLGSPSAETKFDTALALWEARKLVSTYIRNDDQPERLAGLRKYLERKDSVGVDEFAQILTLLPPPRAEKRIPDGITAFKANGLTYHVQLPDEYTHHRSYPVLIVLHNAGEKARTMLDRWADRAKEEGYILVAPEWEPQNGGYGYTDTEHSTVLDALQNLRRRFSVDGNRVFLFGLGQGGTMALDVGLSHPDLFAGLLPMATQPDYFVRKYWPNAKYLPIYLVNGSQTDDPKKCLRFLFDQWVPSGYPAMHVVYKGRGIEWFGGEVPNMFDWMNRKKRTIPATALGHGGHEFQTMRTTDNRFYWVTTSAIDQRCVNTFVGWSNRCMAAKVTARIDPAQNRIFLDHNGFQQMTLWISRDARLDFEKLVTVVVNGRIGAANHKLRASPSVLEDYLERGDRQNLYISRIELKR